LDKCSKILQNAWCILADENNNNNNNNNNFFLTMLEAAYQLTLNCHGG